MKRVFKMSLVVAALVAAVGSNMETNAAVTAQPCSQELENVRTAILNSNFLGSNADKSRDSLLVKAAAAEAKAEEGKLVDAVAKLDDLAQSAAALADAPKPKLEDTVAIDSAVAAAVACLDGV